MSNPIINNKISDLNNLKVGEEFRFDTSVDYSIIDAWCPTGFKNKIFHYRDIRGTKITFDYISKDYLIFHDTYLLLSLRSGFPF